MTLEEALETLTKRDNQINCMAHKIIDLTNEVGRLRMMANTGELLDAIEEQKRERLERFTLAAMQGFSSNSEWSLSAIPYEAVSLAISTLAALDREHAEQ